jgi:hypothetical protein
VSSLSAITRLTRFRFVRLVALAALLMPAGPFLNARAQQSGGRALVFPVTIQWNRQKAIKWYRLQIAADERFRNVFFDKRVAGERYVASELAPGSYYWRVAPAEPQLGYFSRPVKFFVSGGVINNVKVRNRMTRTRSVPAILLTKLSPGVR